VGTSNRTSKNTALTDGYFPIKVDGPSSEIMGGFNEPIRIKVIKKSISSILISFLTVIIPNQISGGESTKASKPWKVEAVDLLFYRRPDAPYQYYLNYT
jgi:hypothetical protein